MGLAVVVGWESDLLEDNHEERSEVREILDELSAALAEKGVAWREPHGVEPLPDRVGVLSFPYWFLHHLRRVAALVELGEPVIPISGHDELIRDDRKVYDSQRLRSSHLRYHSDCEGFYVPVDFGDPLVLPEEASVPGDGIVGSSHGLMVELRGCAPALGIRLDDDGWLSDAELRRLKELPQDADFAVERVAWMALHAACVSSLATGHAIVFE
jgi:hypothetical protein